MSEGAQTSDARRAGVLVGAAATSLACAWLVPLSVTWRGAPDLHHAWAVPLLMAYLWWERWGERPEIPAARRVPFAGAVLLVVLCAAMLPLRLLLTPFPQWPVLLATYTVACAAAATLAGGLLAGQPGARWIAGPLVLLLAALPLPTIVETGFIGPLREAMAAGAAEISNTLGRPALAAGTSIRLGTAWVGIDEACGGIRSLQACLMIALFFGEWYRLKWQRRLSLVLAGFVAALVGNFGRVVFLCLRANAGAADVRLAHDRAGWCAMVASLGLTALAGWWLGGRRWPVQFPARSVRVDRSAALPWIVVAAALLIFNEVSTRAWYAHGAAERAQVPHWTAHFPEELATFRSEPLTESARETLQPDVYVAGTWALGHDQRAAGYYAAWTHGQLARSIPFLHNPARCLPYSGCVLVRELEPLQIGWTGGTIPFHAFRFHSVSGDILVAFTLWDTDRDRPLEQRPRGRSWNAWFERQWEEVSDARQHQPAQILSVSIPWTEDAPQRIAPILSGIIRR